MDELRSLRDRCVIPARVVTVSWLAILASAVNAGVADELKEKFLRDAPQAWRKLREELGPTDVIQTYESKNSFGDHVHSWEHFKTNGNSCLGVGETVTTDQSGKPQEHRVVWGRNSDYAFQLRRRSAEAPWCLAYLAIVGSGADVSEVNRQLDRLLWSHVNALLMVWLEPLPEIVRKPYFKLTGVREVNVDDGTGIEITFDYPHPKEEVLSVHVRGPVELDGGRIVLDPSRYWCIRSSEINLTDRQGNRSTTVRRKKFQAPGSLALAQSEIEIRGVTGPNVSLDGRVQFEKYQYSPAPAESEFRLSAFGLPEPVIVKERKTPVYLWLALAGMALVISGVAIHRFAARVR